jgi:hypothetical protein
MREPTTTGPQAPLDRLTIELLLGQSRCHSWVGSFPPPQNAVVIRRVSFHGLATNLADGLGPPRTQFEFVGRYLIADRIELGRVTHSRNLP